MSNRDYGLELTNNSKTGWAFSLPRTETCIGATALCKKVCYGNGIRYQSLSHKEKRQRNFRTVEFLLDEGGPELLAENLLMLIDQARPIDWLTARITASETLVPWTLRIHDVGDVHSAKYARAWMIAASKRPECRFWFYTRSFVDSEIFAVMTELASLSNCQGWLSLDAENYEAGILAKCNTQSIWKLALLQDQADYISPDLLESVKKSGGSGQVVSFPYHRAGRHVAPVKDSSLVVCPAVLGAYDLTNKKNTVRACQSCSFCLPG